MLPFPTRVGGALISSQPDAILTSMPDRRLLRAEAMNIHALSSWEISAGIVSAGEKATFIVMLTRMAACHRLMR